MASCQAIVSGFAHSFLQGIYFGAQVRLNRESICFLRVNSAPEGRSNLNRLQTQHLSVILDISAHQVQQGSQLYSAEIEGEFLVEC